MDLIKTRDEEIIRQWAFRQTSPTVLYIASSEGFAGEKLAHFCDEFKVMAPQAQIHKAQDESFAAPAIIIGRHKNIAYQTIPEGRELLLFLEALSAAADYTASSSNEIQKSRIELPANLTVFIAQQCPHCPNIVAQLLLLASENPPLRLTIIDGFLFENQTKELDIHSVPTLILDNKLRWTGQINVVEVIHQCIKRDPSQLSSSSLRQIIESGEAARVAAMMIANGRIFPAFVELLVSERWSVRLGAMVAMEYLADESPDLAAQMIAPLLACFAGLNEQVQGDVVQALAQIKNNEAKGFLAKIASGDYAESVREVATEELESWSSA